MGKPKKELRILSVSDTVDIIRRNFKKMKTRAEVEKRAVTDLGRLLATLESTAEARDQVVALNRVLKSEGEKLVGIVNHFKEKADKLTAENASLQKLIDEMTAPKAEAPPPIAGICTDCRHDASFHNNPSKVCSSVNCRCMAWKAPVSA